MTTTREFRRLSAGQVDIWCCATDDPRIKPKLQHYMQWLSPDEQEEYEQRQHAGQAEDYLASRAFLRCVLAEYVDMAPEALQFEVNRYGKPSLAEHQHNLSFNAAHTHGLTLCAVTNGVDVGVDVEFQTDSQGMLDAADDYLSDTEMAALKEIEVERRLTAFFRFWTLKEAYLKARGEGLSIPLHDFSVLLDGMQVKRLDADDAGHWDLRLLAQDDDFTAALVVAGKINNINAFRCIPKVECKELASLQEILPGTAR